MDNLPAWLTLGFSATTLLTLYMFMRVTQYSRRVVIGAILWMFLQAAVALTGFYTVTDVMPPRLLLFAIGPALGLIALVFATQFGRHFIDGLELRWLVLLQAVRILVEIALFLLFTYGQVSVLMTFEGGNWDILSGLSAPLAWWAYRKGYLGGTGLLLWNSLCLFGVLNAVGRAILSSPFPFQQYSFDQPTIAVQFFPYIFLPTFIVPTVLFCHLAIFRKLLTQGEVK